MKLAPVKNESLTNVVTERIKKEVLGGKYKAGDRLPAERELINQLQVSRVVVREALRRLEAMGVLSVRRGAGIFVAESGSSAVHNGFTSALRIQKVDVAELDRARLILEPVVAESAAENMTTGHLDALRENIEKVEQLIEHNASAHRENIEFHGIVAEATQNKVIKLSIAALMHLQMDLRKPRKDQLSVDTRALFWHKKIFRAFKERQPKKAAELMRQHIMEHDKIVLEETK